MVLTNDYELDIATGTSRTCREWVNRKWTWSEFVERCSRSKDTGETLEEYHHVFTADQRGARKDVGGFVGGYLLDGVRKAGHCTRRSMATLDIDDGTPDVWQRFLKVFNCAGLLYSTHSYTPEKPRFRLVIPFNRSVSPSKEYADESEYEVVTGIIAQKMGPELFDRCSFEAERLLYWPSHPTDLTPVFEYRDAPALDVDELLKEPLPVTGTKMTPVEETRKDFVARRSLKNAEDPTAKRGIIGAFCRVYSIEEAIDTFLTDYYVRADKNGFRGKEPRYTNIGSETSGGLVCYDGKFAYSHHEHDPAHGRCCNAFDLCRIRLFGHLDKGHETEEFNRLPSYIKMTEMAGRDAKVIALLDKERQEKADRDFAPLATSEKMSGEMKNGPGENKKKAGEKMKDSESWREGLGPLNKDGSRKKTPGNLQLIMDNDREFNKIKYNLFSQCDEIKDPTCIFTGTHSPEQVDDCSLGLMTQYLYCTYQITITMKEVMERMLQPSAKKRGFNPIRDYILKEKWDGKPRVETLLIDYLGAEDNSLNRMIMRKWMAGAVGRAIDLDAFSGSGIKMDYCLILFGPQGCGKSTFIETLAVKWRGAISLTAPPKEQNEILHSSWIVELPEMKGLKSSETEMVKDLLSRREDKYRPAYGRTTVKNPRRCVFVGSTNNRYFLKDTTGERRFWVVEIKGNGKVSDWVEKLRRETPQIWAEAYEIYKSGERLMLTDEMEKDMAERAKGFSDIAGDDVTERLATFLDTPIPDNWELYTPQEKIKYYKDGSMVPGTITLVERTRVTVSEIKMCMKDYPGINHCGPRRIEAMLKLLGWAKTRKRTGQKRGAEMRPQKSVFWEKSQIETNHAFENEPAL